MGVPDSTVCLSVELKYPSLGFDKQLAQLLIDRRRMIRNIDMPAPQDLAAVFGRGWEDD